MPPAEPRLCSTLVLLFNIRPWRLRAVHLVATAGPSSSESFDVRAAARGATKREREWVPTASNAGGPGFERVLPRAGGLRRRLDHAPDGPAPARQLAGDRHVRDDGPLARVVERLAPVDEPAVALERVPPHGRVDRRPRAGGLARREALAKCHAASTP